MKLRSPGRVATSLGPAAFLLPLAAIVALIAAISGNWLVFAAMVLVLVGQGLTLRRLGARRD